MTGTPNSRDRVGLTWRIRAGRAEEYDRRHAVVWPSLETRLRELGVESFDIFRAEETVFAVVVARDFASLIAAYAIDPIAMAWETDMAELIVDESDPITGWPMMLHRVWSLSLPDLTSAG